MSETKTTIFYVKALSCRLQKRRKLFFCSEVTINSTAITFQWKHVHGQFGDRKAWCGGKPILRSIGSDVPPPNIISHIFFKFEFTITHTITWDREKFLIMLHGVFHLGNYSIGLNMRPNNKSSAPKMKRVAYYLLIWALFLCP